MGPMKHEEFTAMLLISLQEPSALRKVCWYSRI